MTLHRARQILNDVRDGKPGVNRDRIRLALVVTGDIVPVQLMRWPLPGRPPATTEEQQP